MGNSSAVTPNRRTHLRLDVAETTTSEPPQAHSRAGKEMARGGLGTSNSSNMTRLGTGAISLAPYQKVLTTQTEQTDTGLTLVPLSQWTTIPGYKERPHYKGPSYLDGVTLMPATLASGNLMSEKTVPAAQSGGWAQTLTADVAAVEQPNYPSVLAAMDRHAVTKVVFDENQAITWRFVTPHGAQYTSSQVCLHFGGPVNGNGNGKYSVVARGKYLYLAEWSDQMAPGSKWVQVDTWQYITASNPGETVTVHIRPYRGARGGLFIEFEGDTQSNVGNSGNTGGGLSMQIRSAPQSITTHIFKVDTSQNSPAAPPLGTPPRTAVTGQGPLRIEVARELRIPWQVSVWRFLPTGGFTDLPLTLPWNISTRALLTLYWTADVPAGCSFVASLLDAATGLELTPTGTSGPGYRQYRVNAGQSSYMVSFQFGSDSAQKTTPVLYGYSVQRDAWIGVSAPGEFDTPGTYPGAKVRDVSISGPENDPSHETASANISDLTDSLTTLATRASIRTRIETEYDPAHSLFRSVLFDGYLQKGRAKRRGTAGRVYPSPSWRDFECSFVGMWMRLQQTLTMFRLDLQQPDPNAAQDADGIRPPPKVTDICRALLGYAGFSPGQIDVPDSPIRFFPGGSENGQSLMIDPLSNVAETVVKFAREYLGWYLIWDGNAGTAGGMWRLRPPVPVQGPYNNLATFTLDGSGSGKIPTASESYNGNTLGRAWWGANPTLFVQKGTVVSWVKPAEGNAVCVTATGNYLPNAEGQFQVTNWVCNAKSYDFFAQADGTPILTSDPANPDYLGHFAPIVVVNLGLGEGDEGQHRVNVLCRRIYDVSCHAIKMLTFTAPLALITDSTDSLLANPRPLRYYDPVSVVLNGSASQWLIRNVNPIIRKDSVQMAYYELEAPRAD